MSLTKVNGCCDRCGRETNVTTGSYFDTSMICMLCKDEERAHPDYQRAVLAEIDEVQKGNMNYKGIGLPKELRPSQLELKKVENKVAR